MTKGEAFARAFDHRAALEAYLQAFAIDSTNCTALWRIAEAHIDLGEEAEAPLQRQHYYTAEKWAKRALERCPDEANAHFFVAVSSGLLALYEGGKRKIERSLVVKREAERTLALDPSHHGAYHVLGRWHRELANLNWFLKAAARLIYGGIPPGASNQKAVENFTKAIELAPRWINHHLELGYTYMAMKRWAEARDAFQTVLDLPIQDHMDARYKEQAREALRKLRGRKE